MRKISQTGINLIKSFEGCQLKAYKAVQTETYWTIGWGHYGPDVKEGMTITQEKADAMFLTDIVRYEDPVNNLSIAPLLNQNQFDALVSFCYNCGSGSLMNLCLGRNIERIAESIPLYNKSAGKVITGLVRRRKAEQDLFRTEVNELPKLEKWVVATIVKTWMSPAWDAANENGQETDKENIRLLANKLRLACGMKEDEEFE